MARFEPMIGPPSPCALCGTTGGRLTGSNTGRPRRAAGTPFGIAGVLCHRCEMRLRHRVAAGTPLLDPRPVRRGGKTLAPCAVCGTEGGYVDKHCHVPNRRNATRFGVDGPVCQSCWNKLAYRARRTIRV